MMPTPKQHPPVDRVQVGDALTLIADYFVGYPRDELEERIMIARRVLGDERRRVWLPDPGPERDEELARRHEPSWADSRDGQAASERLLEANRALGEVGVGWVNSDG